MAQKSPIQDVADFLLATFNKRQFINFKIFVFLHQEFLRSCILHNKQLDQQKQRIMKIFNLYLLAFLMGLAACNQTNKSESEEEKEETVTNTEPESEWTVLFDGETLDGWKRYGADEIGPLWSVQNGAIMCDGEGLSEGTEDIGGTLITTQHFGNFELETEWKISEGGNSGILYHVVEKPEYSHAYNTGPEYQVLDDPGWSDRNLAKDQMAGSNYDMFAAPDDKTLHPAGEWNTSKIIYNDGHVEHWLNGEKVVEFDESSEAFKEKYENSKWTKYPGWNKYKEGAIGLQDHGAPVWYRNIRIKEL